MFTEDQMLDWLFVNPEYTIIGNSNEGWQVKNKRNDQVINENKFNTFREAIADAMLKMGNIPTKISVNDLMNREVNFNHCHEQAIKALRYIGKYGKTAKGGAEFPNDECCLQIADELERSFKVIKKVFGHE